MTEFLKLVGDLLTHEELVQVSQFVGECLEKGLEPRVVVDAEREEDGNLIVYGFDRFVGIPILEKRFEKLMDMWLVMDMVTVLMVDKVVKMLNGKENGQE